jgi:hypothetical protein
MEGLTFVPTLAVFVYVVFLLCCFDDQGGRADIG